MINIVWLSLCRALYHLLLPSILLIDGSWVRDCLRVTFGLWVCASGWGTMGIPCSVSSPCAGVHQNPVLSSPANDQNTFLCRRSYARTRHHLVTHNCAHSFWATQEMQRAHDMSHQDKINSPDKVFGNSLHHFLMRYIAISKIRKSPTNHIYEQFL